jgi:hypothetical protein
MGSDTYGSEQFCDGTRTRHEIALELRDQEHVPVSNLLEEEVAALIDELLKCDVVQPGE